MFNYIKLIEKYYQPKSLRHKVYIPHCTAVKDLALKLAKARPGLGADLEIIEIGAMVHDIGIYLTDAPDIGCYGSLPYIAHGYKGRELLEKEGLKEIAAVCERHIGVGLTIDDIKKNNLPIPVRDMTPQTIEEKIICFADKFYSKSSRNLLLPKPLDKVKKSIRKYGDEKWDVFEGMIDQFGVELVYQ